MPPESSSSSQGRMAILYERKHLIKVDCGQSLNSLLQFSCTCLLSYISSSHGEVKSAWREGLNLASFQLTRILTVQALDFTDRITFLGVSQNFSISYKVSCTGNWARTPPMV